MKKARLYKGEGRPPAARPGEFPVAAGEFLLSRNTSSQERSRSQTDNEGDPLPMHEICDEIFTALGMEKVNGLESASSLKAKLAMGVGLK